jgi:hypothetical protein
VRAGEADGLIGIFDNGVTTMQFLPTGNFNGGDSQSIMPASVPPTFIWMSQAGGEYGNAKLVYMSPQIAGFDFGAQYAPNMSNSFGNNAGSYNGGLGNSFTGAGVGTGILCGTATSGCPSMSSGPGEFDGSKIINQVAVGARYQGVFGGLGVLAYGVYMVSGHSQYSGPTVATAAGRQNLGVASLPGSKFNGNFNGLNIGSGGVALTYAGFTAGGNVIGGQKNGYVNLQPQGAPSQIGVIGGVKYVAGPLTVGIAAMDYWDQGNIQMTGLSQHHAWAVNPGLSYGGAWLHRVWRILIQFAVSGWCERSDWRNWHQCQQHDQGPSNLGRQRGQFLIAPRVARPAGRRGAISAGFALIGILRAQTRM